MKQKDVALILVISFMSAVLSLVISNLVFSSSSKKQLRSDVVTAIKPDFNKPDSKYFNETSINPTQIIRIGNDENQKPFGQ